MKKKIYLGVAVLAVAAVAGWNVNLSSKSSDMSDVSLANVEVLAQENMDCPNGCVPNGNGCYCLQWYSCEKEA